MRLPPPVLTWQVIRLTLSLLLPRLYVVQNQKTAVSQLHRYDTSPSGWCTMVVVNTVLWDTTRPTVISKY
jgi:hypothetical protein